MRIQTGTQTIQFCDVDASFTGHIFKVGNAFVVRADGPLLEKLLTRPAANPTVQIMQLPGVCYWRPDLGLFVIPASNIKAIR